MATEKITINGRSYEAREIDFNFICDLQEAGINIFDLGNKILPSCRAYVAYCMGVSQEVAGEEMNQHIIKGGTFDDFITVFTEKINSSDFFRSLNKTTETTTSKRTTKKSEKTEA